MDIKRARELLGDKNIEYDDTQLLELIDDVSFLAQVVVEKIRKMTKKELEEFVKKE